MSDAREATGPQMPCDPQVRLAGGAAKERGEA
ncbi:hypothetical protein FHS33_001817 [Streptomyces calvus]|uniref:Uncharacterized protein n=1 Tax=Streptomyces calvus TaxID=67282 RepID=A0AA40SBM2_9ACTN|nr:hypothetical protein [Streptomyces calvus]MBA8979122.1 hypothetical protein [Streptomyces calvus]